MPSDPSSVQVEFTPEFKRNLRALSRKYHHVRSDVEPVLEQIRAGQFVGDRIQETRHVILKVRVRNRDSQKGKSAGYRIIYQVESQTLVVLITIYSKLDQADITPEQIRRILREFDSA